MNIPLSVFATVCLSVRLSMANAACECGCTNTSPRPHFPFSSRPDRAMAGPYGNSVFKVLRNRHCAFCSGCAFYLPPPCTRAPVSVLPPALVALWAFESSRSDEWEVAFRWVCVSLTAGVPEHLLTGLVDTLCLL